MLTRPLVGFIRSNFGVVRERDEGVIPWRMGKLSEDNREGDGRENGRNTLAR